jgi:addiction module HigA family antidote
MKEKKMNRRPTHPGAILREDVLPAMNLNVTAFAKLLHISRQTVHGVLNETKPVTPNIALRLGKFVGNGAGVWLRMQDAYDLWATEQVINKELRLIKRYSDNESIALNV